MTNSSQLLGKAFLYQFRTDEVIWMKIASHNYHQVCYQCIIIISLLVMQHDAGVNEAVAECKDGQ